MKNLLSKQASITIQGLVFVGVVALLGINGFTAYQESIQEQTRLTSQRATTSRPHLFMPRGDQEQAGSESSKPSA